MKKHGEHLPDERGPRKLRYVERPQWQVRPLERLATTYSCQGAMTEELYFCVLLLSGIASMAAAANSSQHMTKLALHGAIANHGVRGIEQARYQRKPREPSCVFAPCSPASPALARGSILIGPDLTTLGAQLEGKLASRGAIPKHEVLGGEALGDEVEGVRAKLALLAALLDLLA